jgi:hypothetical protein
MADMFYDLDGTLRHNGVNPTPPPEKKPRRDHWDEDGHYVLDGVAYRDPATVWRMQRMTGEKKHTFNYFDAPTYEEFKRRFRRYTWIGCAIGYFILAVFPMDLVGVHLRGFIHFATVMLFGSAIAVALWVTYFTYVIPVGWTYYHVGHRQALGVGLAINATTMAVNHHHRHAQRLAQQQRNAQARAQAAQSAWPGPPQPTPEQIAQQQAQVLDQALRNAQQPGWVPGWND